MSPLSNSRHPGESAVDFRIRRRAVNAGVKRYLRGGKMLHVSSSCVTLPVIGVDMKADAAVANGNYRDVTLVTLPGGKQMRVGRTKGVTDKRAAPKLTRRAARARALRSGRAIHMTYTGTRPDWKGESALVRFLPDGQVAQFDNLAMLEAFGWHPVNGADFA